MSTTLPAAARLRVAYAALTDAHTAFLAEAAAADETDALDHLYETAAKLRAMADQLAEVLR